MKSILQKSIQESPLRELWGVKEEGLSLKRIKSFCAIFFLIIMSLTLCACMKISASNSFSTTTMQKADSILYSEKSTHFEETNSIYTSESTPPITIPYTYNSSETSVATTRACTATVTPITTQPSHSEDKVKTTKSYNTSKTEEYTISNSSKVPDNAIHEIEPGIWVDESDSVIALLSDNSFYGFSSENEYTLSISNAENFVCPYCGSNSCSGINRIYGYYGKLLYAESNPLECELLQSHGGVTDEICENCGKKIMVNAYYVNNENPDYCNGWCAWHAS